MGQVLGMTSSLLPNTWFDIDDCRLMSLGPGQWFLQFPEDIEKDYRQCLIGAAGGYHHAVTDVSDQFTAYRLWGADRRAIIAQGTSLNLGPDYFGEYRCTRCAFARITIVLSQFNLTCDEIIVESSYADYLCAWLKKARGD